MLWKLKSGNSQIKRARRFDFNFFLHFWISISFPNNNNWKTTWLKKAKIKQARPFCSTSWCKTGHSLSTIFYKVHNLKILEKLLFRKHWINLLWYGELLFLSLIFFIVKYFVVVCRQRKSRKRLMESRKCT